MDSTVIMKFGGASLSNTSQFDAIADLIIEKSHIISHLVIVVSAMGTTTDELISLAHTVNPNPPQREFDMLLSVGERISMSLLAMALAKRGKKAMSLTGSQSGIITCTTHGLARIHDIRPKRILKAFEENNIVIVAGFQGVSLTGEITTLGRGGSDTSAVALGIALDAQIVEFYKDVPGFFTKDPKLFSDAILIEELSYRNALTIVERDKGRILHPRSIIMAERHNIPLAILGFQKCTSSNFSKIHNRDGSRMSKKIYEQEESE